MMHCSVKNQLFFLEKLEFKIMKNIVAIFVITKFRFKKRWSLVWLPACISIESAVAPNTTKADSADWPV